MTEKEETLFWELVAKRISGEIQEEESVLLNSLLEVHPELLYTLETAGNYWHSLKENAELKERESALEKHMLRMQDLKLMNVYDEKESSVITSSGVSPWVYGRIAMAAAVLGFVVLSVFLFRDQQEIKTAANKLPFVETIVALKGSKNHFILPDGSKVWLNGGTTIKYQASFNTDSVREVFLSGEAYFEIRHDNKHPFWIHTSQMDIRDIGTSFNVKAYPFETITEATLIEGSIEVKVKNGKEFTTLKSPNEKITVRSTEKNDSVMIEEKQDGFTGGISGFPSIKVSTTISPVQEDSLLAETAWLKGAMIFRNESFEELALRMERWYNVNVRFEKEEYKKYRFSGTFHNETIEQALRELQVIKSFSFVISDNNIVIK